MQDISLRLIFALVLTTVNHYIDFSLDILCEMLHHIPESKIQWLTEREMSQFVELVHAKHSLLATQVNGIWE